MRASRPLAVLAVACISLPAPAQDTPWPADVPNWVKPAPGEHPRMLFRKADLPRIKERARTPEGQAIIKRLRFLLDGAEGLTAPKPAGRGERVVGAFSIGHAAGYGLLYQLTGDAQYAKLGLECFERMLKGERDRDERYSFSMPNGELRSGSSWAVAALGYDLCYNGWSRDDQVRIAKAFLSTKGQQGHNLEKVVRKPKYRPSKNHTGGIMCGAAAAAALAGDPGTEPHKIWEEWLPDAYKNTIAMLTEGFGDHGWYAESQGPSHVSSDTGLQLWLKTARIACGKDFISPRTNAQYIALRWVMEIIPQEGRPQYPLRMAAGASYGTHEFTRCGDWSHGGQFAQGFGIVQEKYLPAMLWVYQNFVEPYEHGKMSAKDSWFNEAWLPKDQKSYDGTTSPWKTVMAFVNWPIGVQPANPAGLLPQAIEDKVHGYYFFRNGWKDKDDIAVSALLGWGPKDAYKPKFGTVMVWGLGRRYEFGSFLAPARGEFVAKPNGSGAVSAGGKHLAVDFSGASGAPLLLATIGVGQAPADGVAKSASVSAGGQKFEVMTLSKGAHPEPTAQGDKVAVGGQTVGFDGKMIVFGK